ncbi:MAG: AraC family transcriptional regulator [Bacteroidota bacterium]
MCQENMEITTKRGDRIAFMPHPGFIDQNYSHWVAEDVIGTLRLVEYRDTYFKIWLNHYVIHENTVLQMKFPGLACLSLAYMLKGDLYCDVKGIPNKMTRQGYFNMVYLPKIELEYYMQKGDEYVMIGIDFQLEYLKSLNIPVLTTLISQAETKNPSLLNLDGLYTLIEMTKVANELKDALLAGSLSNSFHIRTQAQLLADKSFEQASILWNNDVKLLQQIQDYIINNLDSVNIDTIASEFQMTNVQLRKFFKRKLNINPSNYVKDKRMNRAYELLRDSDLQIKSIALAVGYNDGGNFSTAFHERYGIWPKEIRRKGKGLEG